MTIDLRTLKATVMVAVAAVGLSTIMATPGMATAFCHPVETGDGFVALRKAPAAAAGLVGKMTAEDEVLIGQSQRGNWIEVTWWRGDDRLNKGFGKAAGKGWVSRKLIEAEC